MSLGIGAFLGGLGGGMQTGMMMKAMQKPKAEQGFSTTAEPAKDVIQMPTELNPQAKTLPTDFGAFEKATVPVDTGQFKIMDGIINGIRNSGKSLGLGNFFGG